MVFKNIVADEDPEEMYADLKQIKTQSANQNSGRRKSAFALQLQRNQKRVEKMKSLYKVALKEDTNSKSQWGKVDKDEKPSGTGSNSISKSMSKSLRKSVRSMKSPAVGSASDSVDSEDEALEVDS